MRDGGGERPHPSALHVRVEGEVQGVGFRRFVEREATALALRGWVRNLPDGGVEVRAEGAPATLARLRARIAQGPPHARVNAVVDLARDPSADVGALADAFRILRDR